MTAKGVELPQILGTYTSQQFRGIANQAVGTYMYSVRVYRSGTPLSYPAWKVTTEDLHRLFRIL